MMYPKINHASAPPYAITLDIPGLIVEIFPSIMKTADPAMIAHWIIAAVINLLVQAIFLHVSPSQHLSIPTP